MKLREVRDILNAKILTKSPWEEIEVQSACGCDLMSDVLAFVKNQALLLTGLSNPQVVRTAEMMDIKTIVFVRGKVPQTPVLELAEDMGITVLSTEYPLYIACGELYKNGLGGRGE
ncbi:MAG: hypothetical protein E7414_02450 [Ruminococcaceae bacterium]|nr:hypothetical protein [Oscillospiraceae bacterium]